MKHILRLLVAVSAAAVALVLNIIATGQFFNLPGALPSVIAVFVLSAAILYLDVLLRKVGTEQWITLSIAGVATLVTAFFLQQLLSGFQVSFQAELMLVAIVVVPLFFGIVAYKAAELYLPGTSGPKEATDGSIGPRDKILDTSVIIDGRILDIAETHFIDGPFIIPNYVLREIQLISDSPDPIKRNRGRRGLEMLNKLQNHSSVKVKISYTDYSDIREVDAKLVRMSRQTGAKLITNDFNLNMVAELQGVQVLNLNNLTNALKPVVLPGEDILIDVIKEGKDENQGIGYLEDGTMVVIENGGSLLGKSVRVNVTSIIQTAAGKMIFTRAAEVIEDSKDQGQNNGKGRGRRGRGGDRDRDRDRGNNEEGEGGGGRGRRGRGGRDRGGDRDRGDRGDRGDEREPNGNTREPNEREPNGNTHAGDDTEREMAGGGRGRRNR